MIRYAIAAFLGLLLFTVSAYAGHSHHKHKHQHQHQKTFVIKFQLEYIPYTPMPKTKPIAWYALPPTGDEIYHELINENTGWNGELNHYER